MAGSAVEILGSTAVGAAVTLEIRRIAGASEKAGMVGDVGLVVVG
jgi:hypothetical protein